MPPYYIFISYRRSDSAGHARALHRDLARRFDVKRIFFDRQSIDAGSVYTPDIQAAVQAAPVVLVLIAPGWLDVADADSRRRLDDPADLVRQEVALALQAGRRVIPVLFDDAAMPAADKLPLPLQGLAARDAHMLRGKNCEYEVQFEQLVRLIAAVPGVEAPHEDGLLVAGGGGAGFEVYRGLRYAPVRLRAPLRRAFDPLIEDRTRIFAGRRQAITAVLDFAAAPESGCLVITAPPGFGKTALIAALVALTPEAFAYHFFAPVYGAQTLDEKFFLQSLLEQMASWKGTPVELPDDLNALRALYQQFISVDGAAGADGAEGAGGAGGKRQVLVLDGLDEVTAWSLRPYLARRLPAQLRMVATVRDVGQDWRSEFGFPAEQLHTLALDGLQADDIRELLASLGGAAAQVAAEDALLALLVERAAYEDDVALGADPFYVRFVAEDLAAGTLAPADIGRQPKGLEAWLDRWWQQLRAHAGDAPVRDLFGTLAAALGPIGRAELEDLNPSLKDDWAGDRFDEVLGSVRRLVRCDEAGAYLLAHPRLRSYVADPRRIVAIDHYRAKLGEHVGRWAVHGSNYALRWRIAHLLDRAAGEAVDLEQWFDAAWIAAQWQGLGSYLPLVADLDRVARTAAAQSEVDLPALAALTTARQTAAELMAGLPDALIVAWVRAGDVQRALDCLMAQGRHSPDSIDALIAVAQALLEHAREHAALAYTLVLQAITLLPRRVALTLTLGSMRAIAQLLHPQHRMPGRAAVLAEFARQCEAFEDPLLRSCVQAAACGVLFDSPDDAPTVRSWRLQALGSAHACALWPDRIHLVGLMLPCLQAHDPQAARREIQAVVEADASIFENGNLVRLPLVELLQAWAPEAADLGLMEALAERLFVPTLDQHAESALSALVIHWLRLRQQPIAWRWLDRLRDAEPLAGLWATLLAASEIHGAEPGRIDAALREARAWVAPERHDYTANHEGFVANLCKALAACGQFDEALATAASIQGGPHLNLLSELARGKHQPVPAADRQAWLEALERQARADPSADVDARADFLVAIDRQREAESICLANFSAGRFHRLQSLAAWAWQAEGKTEDAMKALAAIASDAVALQAMALMLQHCAGDAAESAAWAECFARRVQGAPDLSKAATAARAAIVAMLELHQRSPETLTVFGPAVSELVSRLSHRDAPAVQLLFAATFCHLDATQGASLCHRIIDGLEALVDVEPRSSHDMVRYAIETLARGRLALGAGALDVERRLRSLAARLPPSDDPLDAGIEASWIAWDLARGCDAAEATAAAAVDRIEAAAAVASKSRFIQGLLALVSGTTSGENNAQARAAAAAAAALAILAPASAPAARRQLDRWQAAVAGIGDARDRASAITALLEAARSSPALLGPALDAAWALLDCFDPASAARQEGAVAVIAAECAAGYIEAAKRRIAVAAADLDRSALESECLHAAERAALEPLDGFEQDMLRPPRSGLPQTVLHALKVQHCPAALRPILVELVLDDKGAGTSRERRLDDLLPQLAAVLRVEEGAAGIERMVAAIGWADRMLADAAALVAGNQAQAGCGPASIPL